MPVLPEGRDRFRAARDGAALSLALHRLVVRRGARVVERDDFGYLVDGDYLPGARIIGLRADLPEPYRAKVLCHEVCHMVDQKQSFRAATPARMLRDEVVAEAATFHVLANSGLGCLGDLVAFFLVHNNRASVAIVEALAYDIIAVAGTVLTELATAPADLVA